MITATIRTRTTTMSMITVASSCDRGSPNGTARLDHQISNEHRRDTQRFAHRLSHVNTPRLGDAVAGGDYEGAGGQYSKTDDSASRRSGARRAPRRPSSATDQKERAAEVGDEGQDARHVDRATGGDLRLEKVAVSVGRDHREQTDDRDQEHHDYRDPAHPWRGDQQEGAKTEPAHVEQPTEQVVALVASVRPTESLACRLEQGRRREHGQSDSPDRLVRLSAAQVLAADDRGEGTADRARDQGDHKHRRHSRGSGGFDQPRWARTAVFR